MSLNLELLTLLKGGKICSGEMLGDALGISRAAVWKQLEKLRAVGIDVESVRGKGYRIPGGIELLESDEIQRQLPVRISDQLKGIHVAEELDSTNTWLKEQADYLRDRQVCLAERQTAGRGRRGRHWVSPFGCNLYLSLAWGFEGGIKALEGLSLAVAVAVCRALEPGAPRGTITLKWPNDIFYRGGKIGGILVEMMGDPSGECQAVIGVGLNCGMGEHAKAANAIDQPWADVREFSTVSRNTLAALVIGELVTALVEFRRLGFEAFRPAWVARDGLKGQPVVLQMGAKRHTGINRGISDTGALLLEVDGQTHAYNAGEISLRAAQ